MATSLDDDCASTSSMHRPNQALGLILEGDYYGLESIYDYEPGGHHPVHLGDLLGDSERYKVLHKLGKGGYANVWLCRDVLAPDFRYIALKILIADASNEDCPELRLAKLKEINVQQEPGGHAICLPLDQFEIHGANGKHICFVFPVLGPRVTFSPRAAEDPDRMLRRICRQITEALSSLHRHGICHGDFTPANILLGTSGLDGLTEEEVMQSLGDPIRVPILASSGEPHTESTAPQYMVRSLDFNETAPQFVTDEAFLIDFGESFEGHRPPEDLGIPQSYRAPEIILDSKPGVASDIWALACTLFELRTGRKLFNMFDDEQDEHLYFIALMLGKFPEPWWANWESRKNFFKDDLDSEGRLIEISPMYHADNVHPAVVQVFHSIEDMLSTGYWRPDIWGGQPTMHRDISEEEKKLFADLLGKMLKYEPEERLSLAEALEHEWFKMSDDASCMIHDTKIGSQ